MPYNPSPDLSRQPPASRWRMAEILLVIAHDAWNRVSCLNSCSHFLQASGEGFDLLLLHFGWKKHYSNVASKLVGPRTQCPYSLVLPLADGMRT
jgi:hypothetical protein